MKYLKKRRLIFTLVVVLATPVPTTAHATADIFGAMFRMMLLMMNAMSDTMLGNNNDLGWGSGNPLGMGMTTLPLMSGMYGLNPVSGFGGMPGMSPWSGMGGVPFNGMNPWSTPFNSWSNPFGGSYPSYASSPYGMPGYGGWNEGYPARPVSLLEGRWFGTSGEVLEVRGNRFRLQDAQSGIDGAVRIENNVVNLYSPQTGAVMQYVFVRNQYELMLQDQTGRVLRFQLQSYGPSSYRF